MENSWNLTFWIVTWMVAAAVVLYGQWKRKARGAGVILAYVLNLWLIHWPAAAIYLLPWYSHYDPSIVESGLRQSTYAIISFGVGSVMFAPFLMRLLQFSRPGNFICVAEPALAKAYGVVGLVCFLVLMPLLGGLPSVTAIIASGLNLLVVGLVLALWKAWQEQDRQTFLRWLLAGFCLPALTLISQGFMSYGTAALIAFFAFAGTFYRPRWKLILIGLFLGYLGLSFYVSYMRDREAIREIVWSGQSVGARVERVYLTIRTIEWFDPYDLDHLMRIDDRLNQDRLVGIAVDYLGSGFRDFASGETLWQALIALIPRAIWPGKPVVAGSMNLVSDYTGIRFDVTTSVGIGQVMESYINFGTAGVVLGFLVFGIVTAVLDNTAGERLLRGDWQGFALWYLPALSLLQVGGSLVEVTSSAAGAVVLALLTNWCLYRLRGRELRPVPGVPHLKHGSGQGRNRTARMVAGEDEGHA
jgi:hypothetical protein